MNHANPPAQKRGRVATVAEYLAPLPKDVRAALEKLRKLIKAAVPDAEEVISYQIPAFKRGKMLVGFGAAESHCTFFVMSTAVMRAHAAELAKYETGKGSIRFQPEKPLPAALVRKLIQARIAENEKSGKR